MAKEGQGYEEREGEVGREGKIESVKGGTSQP
jgi:hypothetical protein